MKIYNLMRLPFAALSLTTAMLFSFSAMADTAGAFEQTKPLRIALVNFKTCVEKSKQGKKEQTTFEALKKQMESILMEKEKSLSEVSAKFNDMDYLDSLSPEAEAELKKQYRTLTQEFTQQQNQFYQSLSQTNVMVVQKLTEAVTKATQEVAKKEKIDLVLTEDSTFYAAAAIDISDRVVVAMDDAFAKDAEKASPAADTKN